MGSEATISSKGQITIPVEVRRRLGLRPGDKVRIEIEGDVAVLRAAPGSYTEALAGLGAEMFAEAGGAEAWLRGERDGWGRE